MTLPLRWAEAALKRWMNWPGFTPCWPKAGPIGGAGVAVPPGAWSLNWTVISFLAMTYSVLGSNSVARSIGGVDDRRLDALSARAVVTITLLHDYAAGRRVALPAPGQGLHHAI